MKYLFALLAVLLFATTTNVMAITIGDASFEDISVAPNSFLYSPTSSDWTFSTLAGVIDPFSAFGSPEAPDGEQFAFIQDSSYFEQSISFAEMGNYTISYFEAGRFVAPNPSIGGNLDYNVSIDGTIIHSDSTTSNQSFISVTSSVFSVTAGSHLLKFEGTTLTDDTGFFDSISINPIPEPTTMLLLGSGLIGLAGFRRKFRKG
ncbi:PEP-CTERM sorting domain-containing protein [Thermodesulfobacteriota bacterium]